MDRAPSVRRTEAAVRGAEGSLSSAKASYWPQLRLSGNYAYAGNNANSYALFNNRNITLGLSWPLFNRFQREQQVSERQPRSTPNLPGPKTPSARSQRVSRRGSPRSMRPGTDRAHPPVGPGGAGRRGRGAGAVSSRVHRHHRSNAAEGAPRGRICGECAVRIPAREGADRSHSRKAALMSSGFRFERGAVRCR